MKPTYFVLALVLALAPSRVVMADATADAQKALDTLKTDVQNLQASQKPMHDADKAFDDAKKALGQNQDLINAKKSEIKKDQDQFNSDKKKATDAFNKSGGLVANPDFPQQQLKAQADWDTKKAGLTKEQSDLESTRSQTLQPAYDAAKKDKDAKDKAHDALAKLTETDAKAFHKANQCENGSFVGGVLGGIGRGLGSIVSSLSDDCQEVRGKVRPGLCKGQDIELILAKVGIDAKSKSCGPVNGLSGGGFGGAGNGIGGAGVPQ